MKNKKYISILFFFSCTVYFYSCDSCRNDDCPPIYAQVKINFKKDGKSLLFGNAPIIPIDSFRMEVTTTGDEVKFTVFEDEQYLRIQHPGNFEYKISNPGFENHVFSSQFSLVEEGRCCTIYQFDQLTQNGHPICQQDCEDFIFKVNL